MILIKRISILYIFACLLSSSLFAQRVNFDQLKKDILEAQDSREKATAMMVLGSSFSPREVDLTFKYADSILLMSEQEDSDFYTNASGYLQAIGNYKKGNLVLAKKLFKTSYSYFKDKNEGHAVQCLNFIGIIHLRTSAADSAVTVFTKILENTEQVSARLSAHGNLGRAYRQLGNYEEAINNFEQCVNLDSTNRFSILNSYMNIASIFIDMEFYDRGIEMLRHANIENIGPQPILAAYFNNLGEAYFQNEEYDSAIKYLSKGFELAKSMKQNQLTIKNRLIISEIYLLQDHKDSSLALLKAVEKDLRFYPAPTVLIDYNLKNANYFLTTRAYDSVIHYANEVLEITNRHQLQHQTKNTYELIAQAYEALAKSDSSAYYYKKHGDFISESALSDKQRFAQEAKAKYMLAQKEKEIIAEKATSGNLSLWKKILIGLMFVLLGISFFYFYRLRKSKTETKEQISRNKTLTNEIEKNKNELLKLKSRALLPVNDIISIKADGHYLEFYLVTKSKPEIDRNQIKSILENLPSKFVQIHRSYIVNVDHIKIKYADKVELNDGKELPVSRTFKAGLNEALSKQS